jgi:hypothetical protein
MMRGKFPGDVTDTLTITVLQPSGFSTEIDDGSGNFEETSTVTGTRENDTVKVVIKTGSFNVVPESDGKVTVKVMVEDAEGLTDTLTYRLKFSEATNFICDLTIANNKGASNVIQFGTAVGATTGYGEATDGDGFPLGSLDYNFCEYELPNYPPDDVFDVRWAIPNINGINRNIFPEANSSVSTELIYRGRLQSGGEAGSTSSHYPLTITWNSSDVPAQTDVDKNSAGYGFIIQDAYSGGLFKFDMNTGFGASTKDVEVNNENGTITITIYNEEIQAFQIKYSEEYFDQPLGVEGIAGLSTQISKVTPNPFSSTAQIYFGTAVRQNVKLEIVDQLGKIVKVLEDKSFAPGNDYKVQWNGTDSYGNECASGQYTCRMVTATEIITHPIVIVK